MAQSNAVKYLGREDEIRSDVQLQGWLPPMDKYGAKDTIRWEAYVTKLCGGKAPPISTVYARSNYVELLDYIGTAILRLLAKQQAEIERLRVINSDKLREESQKEEGLKQQTVNLMQMLEGLETQVCQA